MDDFYNAIRSEISMIKGDTLAFNFQIQGLGGATPSEIVFTCREKPLATDTLFTQSLTGGGITLVSRDSDTDTNTYSVRVRPDQTENITPARYFYDLELSVGEDVLTLMKGRLNIDWDVTRG